jgi:Zn/Cd-binding protein ZinT
VWKVRSEINSRHFVKYAFGCADFQKTYNSWINFSEHPLYLIISKSEEMYKIRAKFHPSISVK